MRVLLAMAVLCACHDYEIQGVEDPPPDGEDTGSVEDTSDPFDTAGFATEPIYLNTGEALYAWDPALERLTEVGEFATSGGPVTRVTDIAIDLDGRLYAVTYQYLFRVDPETAQAWQIATLPQELMGLTCVSDGRLVGTGDGVYIIDAGGAGQTTLVEPGHYETSGDIVGLPDGMLYWTVEGGDLLIVVDPDTGSMAERGNIGVEDIFGLGYAFDDLYGFTQTGRALRINAAFGTLEGEVELPGQWYGATTNPVLW